ncbi:MAG: cytosine/adenosine deaminase-related metal-dependent hydrolase [Saprospiraceae bacterium]|jgi:cytosine/adenosine deaminase-related metal-dependent hydrolase
MKKITADYVFPIASEPIKNGVVVVDDAGKILAVDERKNHDEGSLEEHQGIITPGFINTHCHLELSHMKGKVETGTSLIPFITKVVTMRNVAQEEIDVAIEAGDREMYEGGIVAVGDISNKLDTKAVKEKSKIRYYSFVEMFDFLQDGHAQQYFDAYMEVYNDHADGNGNRKSTVPHAPYSVSKKLFSLINETNENDVTVSIHNQETPPENELFMHKKGAFLDFFDGFDIGMDHFKASGKTSIHYALEHMNPNCRTLFVHNTLSTAEDIQAAQKWSNRVYWATCANANLYIENRLPNYQTFIDNNAKMTIGTDSLTSNWTLSILDEMKAIHRYQSYVKLPTLLKWATLNGAEALGMDDDLGSIEVGKTPGLNLLNVNSKFELNENTKVKRLV